MPTFVDLDRRAVLRSIAVVGSIPEGRWDAATPCSDWRLGDLVAHMTAHHRGFAAAATGGADPVSWRPLPLGARPREEYADAARAVLAAFAEDGVLDRRLALPEITDDRTFPGTQAISFHLVDYVVHTWDVAASIGVPADLDADVVAAALDVAEREVPVGPSRERPGASFAPPRRLDGNSTTAFDRLLALLGRSPDWTAA